MIVTEKFYSHAPEGCCSPETGVGWLESHSRGQAVASKGGEVTLTGASVSTILTCIFLVFNNIAACATRLHPAKLCECLLWAGG